MTKRKSKGKLIVIDGSDGSGKATQTRLLVSRLKKEGHKVKTFDFPHYENVFGALIGECLTGQRGNFLSLDPKIASVLYAGDRFESKKKLEMWIEEGNTVILDRYVSASQIHQGGKIKDAKKRREFLNWLNTVEYKVFGIPKPNVVVYLSVPTNVSLKLLQSSDQKKKKRYARRKKDLVEENLRYLRAARKTAESLAQSERGWKKVHCVEKGVMRSRQDIHEEVYRKIRRMLK